ncbi:hypothetical protein C5745_04035 [Sphingobacterium haloxyli]|uniref:Uncharacterized protein n=1 Tax=Sphingobacterium haloxyli TaxID=2100533 RepID=A0A2S9J6J9_9SPHI|nr:hypothetical protein C5745_04035 [Sphingobacterium haloxyli]
MKVKSFSYSFNFVFTDSYTQYSDQKRKQKSIQLYRTTYQLFTQSPRWFFIFNFQFIGYIKSKLYFCIPLNGKRVGWPSG